MKTITIDNELFEIKKTAKGTITMNSRTLYDVYERPSMLKMNIWSYWLDWAGRNNVTCFGVSSYNCMVFTLSGLIDIDGEPYVLYITKTRQELYPLFEG